jgi:putative tricarboxylic transport membrane protein
LFWIALGIPIWVVSVRPGPGSLSVPGPGLLTLGCGALFVMLGFALFMRTLKGTARNAEALREEGVQFSRLSFVILSLLAYAFLMDIVGFSLAILLWMIFVCKLGRISWKGTVMISVIATCLCYILFQ